MVTWMQISQEEKYFGSSISEKKFLSITCYAEMTQFDFRLDHCYWITMLRNRGVEIIFMIQSIALKKVATNENHHTQNYVVSWMVTPYFNLT